MSLHYSAPPSDLPSEADPITTEICDIRRWESGWRRPGLEPEVSICQRIQRDAEADAVTLEACLLRINDRPGEGTCEVVWRTGETTAIWYALLLYSGFHSLSSMALSGFWAFSQYATEKAVLMR